jgi:hypothetical protein
MGSEGADLQRRLDELTAKRDELVRLLGSPAEPRVRLHPNLGQVYRRKVEELQTALQDRQYAKRGRGGSRAS